MDKNFENYIDWCFMKHIYFYSCIEDCPQGYCIIIKWVNGVATIGKKFFPVENIQSSINELYKLVYLKNNQPK